MGAAVGDYDNDGDPISSSPPSARTRSSQQRRRHVRRRHGAGRHQRHAVEHERRVPRLRPRRPPRPLRRAAISTSRSPANKVCHDAVGARDYCSPRAYKPVPDRALPQRRATAASRTSRSAAGISKADGAGPRRRDRRLQRRRLARPLRRQRRHAEPALDQPARRHLRGRRAALRRGAQRRRQPRGQHGHRVGRLRRRRRRGSLRHQHHRRDLRALRQRRARATSRTPAREPGWRRRPRASTGFGTDWFDYDNDGWLDLFVANGAVNIVEAQRGQPPPFRMKNQLFHNAGGGRFAETSAAGGAGVRARRHQPRRGLRRLDNDGDVDILVTNNGGPARLLINQAAEHGGKNHWLEVALRQPARRTASRSARGSAWSAPGSRRCGGACAPTAAICPRATRASTSGSAPRPPSRPSSSSGPTASASGGRRRRRQPRHTAQISIAFASSLIAIVAHGGRVLVRHVAGEPQVRDRLHDEAVVQLLRVVDLLPARVAAGVEVADPLDSGRGCCGRCRRP